MLGVRGGDTGLRVGDCLRAAFMVIAWSPDSHELPVDP